MGLGQLRARVPLLNRRASPKDRRTNSAVNLVHWQGGEGKRRFLSVDGDKVKEGLDRRSGKDRRNHQ